MRRFKATRTLLIAAVLGTCTGAGTALGHGPQPAGAGLLMFTGVIFGAGAVL
jgi:hypothetical protein